MQFHVSFSIWCNTAAITRHTALKQDIYFFFFPQKKEDHHITLTNTPFFEYSSRTITALETAGKCSSHLNLFSP